MSKIPTPPAQADLRIEWNVPIAVSDGTVLRADVFRPAQNGRYPVILNHGPYAKGLHFADGFPGPWESLLRDHPQIAQQSSTKYFNWEAADPERWVPNGYVCVRIDSRGAGCSPGSIDPFSVRETQDFVECIEWAGVQPWSNGKVGLLGISYYAANQWQVAALRPRHLAAICPFEGFSDYYRDVVRHGGILNTFMMRWYPNQVINAQYGLGINGRLSRYAGTPICGAETLDEATRLANRTDIESDQRAHELLDDYFEERMANLESIEVPVLSMGNWGGQGLHLRGNIEGFLRAGSKYKWLEMHGLEHWTEFYTNYGFEIQKRFFDCFLRGSANGWLAEPPLRLQIRTVHGFVERCEQAWPLERTEWTRFHLDASAMTLDGQQPGRSPGSVTFEALTQDVTFTTKRFTRETEITGPVAAKIYISSSTADADLFLTLRLFDVADREVLFVGAVDPNAPLTQGWLRASHRKLDVARSRPWQPFHTHDTKEPLVPDQIYELNVEVWPTSIVIPAGYSLRLTVSGHDFDHRLPEPLPRIYGIVQRGCSVMLHDDPVDRPAKIYGGRTTVYTSGDYQSFLLLPVIPAP